jgi:hypothetical protein
MADLKISQLTAASTPLAGTEVLPIVQSSSTKKVSVADLTAGRAVAMAGGSFTDNITQSTAAKGINFTANTPAAGMTSELLNWYEEGTWTPVLSDGTNNATMSGNNSGVYTRIGRQVTVIGQVETTSLGSVTGNIRITGLPFAPAAGTAFYSSGAVGYAELLNITAGQNIGIGVFSGNNYITMYLWDSAAGVTPLQASEWSADGTAAIQITYFV